MSEPMRCAVCGEPGTPPDLAECADCGEWFHLVLDVRSTDPGCGAATVGGHCGFSFACNPCIEVAEAGAAAGGAWRSAVR